MCRFIRQPYGTIDSVTPAAEAAAIAAGGSIPGETIANLVLYGNPDGPTGSLPAAPYSPPPLSSLTGIDSVGTTAADFRVNESGAAVYSIPIATAAGTAGVAPQISLNYSSADSTGIAGHGWSIDGLSSISRCRQTYDQDREMVAIKFGATDRFCLDGQRLLPTSSGNYGDVGMQYRTEIESGVIVTSVGGTAGSPDYFTARRKDGSTSYFGKASPSDTTSAKLADGLGRVLTWSIRKFEDSVNRAGGSGGNPIWYVYDSGSGYQRIDEIRWAYGSAAGPTGHKAYLKFHYEIRGDKTESYVDGSRFYNDQRIERIESYNNVRTQAAPAGASSIIRQYKLRYGEGIVANDQVSRLTSVEECAETACLPKTMFGWNVPVISPTPQYEEQFSLTNNVSVFQPAGYQW